MHDDQYFLFYNSCRVTEWPFWFGLILPFIVMYVFNWIAFTIIMITLLRRRKVENKKNASFFQTEFVHCAWTFTIVWSRLGIWTFCYQLRCSRTNICVSGSIQCICWVTRSTHLCLLWTQISTISTGVVVRFRIKEEKDFHVIIQKGCWYTSSKYKITDTGTLPIDQKLGTFQMQSTDPKGFSSVSADFEPGVSTFQMATVENPESDI